MNNFNKSSIIFCFLCSPALSRDLILNFYKYFNENYLITEKTNSKFDKIIESLKYNGISKQA